MRNDAVFYIKNIHGNGDNPTNGILESRYLMQWTEEEIRQKNPGKISTEQHKVVIFHRMNKRKIR